MTAKPLLTCCPANVMRTLYVPHPWIAISITDPPCFGGKPARLSNDSNRLDFLRLSFGDFYEKHFRIVHNGIQLRDKVMTKSDGEKVAEFLRKWHGKYRVLVCNCEAGVSRSPSMLLAIAEWLGVPRSQLEPVGRNWDAQPLNSWVYKVTKASLKNVKVTP